MKSLILIRHGQSTWNAKNKFTGWVDSPLSEQGIREAKKAGHLIKQHKVNIYAAFTSYLSRAIDTLYLLLEQIQDNNIIVNKSWYLNERHYGSLTGLNKAETKKIYLSMLFLVSQGLFGFFSDVVGDSNSDSVDEVLMGIGERGYHMNCLSLWSRDQNQLD